MIFSTNIEIIQLPVRLHAKIKVPISRDLASTFALAK